jgi:hypothetical protein
MSRVEGGMPKFKIQATQSMALDFEITATSAEAADAAVSYLLAMSKIVFVPMESRMAPRYARGLEGQWRLEITPKEHIN